MPNSSPPRLIQYAGTLFPMLLAVMGCLLVVRWVRSGPMVSIAPRVPGLDFVPAEAGGLAKVATRPVPGEPVLGPGRPSIISAAWPWFRGPDRDAINKETVHLARTWPAAGPKCLWTVPVGDGYAAAAIQGGRVYVLDHIHDMSSDLLRNLSVADCGALAASLAKASPADPKTIDTALETFFPIEGRATTPSRNAISQAEYDRLKQTITESMVQQRDLTLRCLQNGAIDDLDRSADTLRCLALDDGREIWRNGYRVLVAQSHGMSRTIPAVVGDCVITLGPKCQLACWDAATGKSRWLIDLVLEYGATVPPWYCGQCPFIDTKTDRLIVAPGGKALVMAIDYHTGKVLWESPNPQKWTMTHVSIVPLEFAGRRMYVYCGKGGVAGIAADNGELLWDTTDWQIAMATCPTPVVVGDGRIFFCGGYNSGAMMLQLREEQGRIVPQTALRLAARQFSSEQQTPILWQQHLYGVRQKDQQLVCMDLEGKELWNSGRDKFGAGPYLIADGLIYAMDNDGVLTVAEATPAAYRRTARAQVIENGTSSWGPMALAAGRLVVRDSSRMACIEIAEH
jgi:outer membrane protein assembly factor BamB